MKQLSQSSQLLFSTLFTIIFILALPVSSEAAVRARLDRQTISIDETVNLTVEADGALNSIADLDSKALENDFSVLNSSTSSNFQIINGTSKATKTWTLELEPKRIGNFEIPPFHIGGQQSNALTLTVTQPTPITSATPGAALPNVFIEVTPEMDTPAYLQAQITVSVKLFINSQLHLTEASLEEPDLENATVIKLGDDRRYQSRKNDLSYQVIERKYAIIAEAGQEVTVPPLLFQAVSISGNNRRFPSDPFFDRFSGRGQRLRTRSQELKISLTQIPEEFRGKIWLPARKVAIMENLTGEQELKVGEPLTRTIQIEALGLTAEQLPQIKPETPDGGKLYLDQPEHQTEIDGTLLHGVKRQSMAFIPAREGLFILPEITIDWWDVANNKQQQTVLPARKIKVIKAASAKTPPQNSTPAPATSRPQIKTESPESPTLSPDHKTANHSLRLWQGLSTILLLAWLMTILLWHKSRRRLVSGRKKEKTQSERKPTANRESIKKACLDNNPQAAHQSILGWGAAIWPHNPPPNLQAIATNLKNPELRDIFANLEEALYSPNDQTWDGKHFWQTIADQLQIKTPTSSSSKQKKRLPPLYNKK